jgi:hypothetical protein
VGAMLIKSVIGLKGDGKDRYLGQVFRHFVSGEKYLLV